MALALNNLTKVDMPLSKETKPNLKHMNSVLSVFMQRPMYLAACSKLGFGLSRCIYKNAKLSAQWLFLQDIVYLSLLVNVSYVLLIVGKVLKIDIYVGSFQYLYNTFFLILIIQMCSFVNFSHLVSVNLKVESDHFQDPYNSNKFSLWIQFQFLLRLCFAMTINKVDLTRPLTLKPNLFLLFP